MKEYTANERMEILKALGTLKGVCENHQSCSDCPLKKGTLCIFETAPTEFKFNYDNAIWRALTE